MWKRPQRRKVQCGELRWLAICRCFFTKAWRETHGFFCAAYLTALMFLDAFIPIPITLQSDSSTLPTFVASMVITIIFIWMVKSPWSKSSNFSEMKPTKRRNSYMSEGLLRSTKKRRIRPFVSQDSQTACLQPKEICNRLAGLELC